MRVLRGRSTLRRRRHRSSNAHSSHRRCAASCQAAFSLLSARLPPFYHRYRSPDRPAYPHHTFSIQHVPVTLAQHRYQHSLGSKMLHRCSGCSRKCTTRVSRTSGLRTLRLEDIAAAPTRGDPRCSLASFELVTTRFDCCTLTACFYSCPDLRPATPASRPQGNTASGHFDTASGHSQTHATG